MIDLAFGILLVASGFFLIRHPKLLVTALVGGSFVIAIWLGGIFYLTTLPVKCYDQATNTIGKCHGS